MKRLSGYVLLVCTYFSVNNVFSNEFDNYLDVLDEVATDISAESRSEDKEKQEIKIAAQIELGGAYYGINNDSRLNPNNSFYDLKETGQAAEIIFEASDRFGANSQGQWFIKTHNFFDSEFTSDQYGRLDELFVDYQMENLYAQLGKRRINWGHAFAFNPVNVVVPPRDLLNPNQETEGRPMIWLQSGVGSWSADLIATRNYNSEFESDSSQWGARLTTVFGSTDMALYFFDGEDTIEGDDYPTLNGVSFSTDIGRGAVVFGEYARFDFNDRNYYDSQGMAYRVSDSYNEYVLGFNVRFGLENTVLFEYFHSSRGYTEEQRVNFFNAVENHTDGLPLELIQDGYLFAEMAKQYVVLGYEKIYKENYQLLVRSLVSEDESVYFGVIGNYQFTPNYSFEIEWLQSFGDENSEFGNSLRDTSFKLALIATY